MAYSMALNSVYNQYLTTYAPKKSDTRFDTHKKSELKSITNKMAQVNKDAPLYKISNNADTRQYIVGLKEESRLLRNTLTSVIGDGKSDSLDGKIAYSSDENVASAKYIKEEDTSGDDSGVVESGLEGEDVVSVGGEIPSYDIEVRSLASPQVNKGRYIPSNTRDIAAGDYSFDLSVNGQGYEFQFSIREDDTNLDIQNRLSRLINNSGISLKSYVDQDETGNSSLRIESTQIGIHRGESSRVFNISEGDGQGTGTVAYLGIDNVAKEASNASFIINGEEASASSNTFILEKTYEITLNGVTPEGSGPATIGIKPDTEAAVENINNIVGGINQFIKSVNQFKEKQLRAGNLLGEINGIAGAYREGMERMGIFFDKDGMINVDNEKLDNSLITGESKSVGSSLKGFADAMLSKSKQISLNPVDYLDKTIVEYKNPGHNFVSPYVASAYAGMMFNSYC